MKKIKVFMISFFSVLMLSSCADKNSIEEVDTVEETEQEIAEREEIPETYSATEEAEIIEEETAIEEVTEEPKRSVSSIEEFEYRVASVRDWNCAIEFNMPEGWEETYKDTVGGTDKGGYIQYIRFVNGENIIGVDTAYSDYFEDDFMGHEIQYTINFNLDGLDDAYEVKNVLEEMGIVDTPYGKAEIYLFKHMIKLSEEFQAILEELWPSDREMFEQKEAIEETDEGEFMVEAREIALIRPQGIEEGNGIVVVYKINKGLEYQGFLEEFLPQMFE